MGYNIRDRLPTIYQPKEVDEETIDRDKDTSKDMKEKGKLYADKRRNAKLNPISEGDDVLVKKMAKTNKLTPNFDSKVFKVIKRKGGDVIVASKETDVKYRRHVSHLQRVPESVEADSGVNSNEEDGSSTSGTSNSATCEKDRRSVNSGVPGRSENKRTT